MSSILCFLPFLSGEIKLTPHRISRQQNRPFLLLELLIAIFLLGTCALPLTELPVKASAEQVKSLYRSQSQRLADEGLAKLKEKLYKNEIAWSEISKSSKERILIFEDESSLFIPPLNFKQFKRKASLKCVQKKIKGTEEWWLMTARIEIAPVQKNSYLFNRNRKGKDAKAFAYYLILHKSSNSAPLSP